MTFARTVNSTIQNLSEMKGRAFNHARNHARMKQMGHASWTIYQVQPASIKMKEANLVLCAFLLLGLCSLLIIV